MSEVADDLLIAYDVGTSSTKAVLFDRAGRELARTRETYSILLPQPGWAEQNPNDWWAALCGTTRTLLRSADVDAERVRGITFSTQMDGFLPVDASGNPLMNSLIEMDTRSADIARRITGGWPKVSGYGLPRLLRWMRITYGAPNLSGRDGTSKILWFREQAPEVWKRTHKVLDTKDYLIHRCTGRFVQTYDCANLTWLLDNRKGKLGWSDDLLRMLDLDRAILPALAHGTDIAGELHSTAAAELGLPQGVAVVAGAGDTSASALGAGTVRPKDVHLHLGTSGWIGSHVEDRKLNPFAATGTICGVEEGRYILLAVQETAGACVDWAARTLGFGGEDGGPAALDRAAESCEPGADGLHFLPWLYGERVPVDEPHLRGGFANLSLAHGRAHMARAVLEGVALNCRWALGVVEKLLGQPAESLSFVGGGATSDVWCRILADALDRPVKQIADPEMSGARGAAMVASVALGWSKDLEESARLVRVHRQYDPRAAYRDRYAEKFAHFVAYYRSTRRWTRALNAGGTRS